MSQTLLSLAGFQVILIGRFWVIAEAMPTAYLPGKDILQVEYKIGTSKLCSQANSMNINSIKKSSTFNLYDTPWTSCR